MKVVLTIAGSDSSGGAGIQADLKSFEAFGVFGATAITVLTAQNTQGVTEIYPLTPAFVRQQIETVLADFDVASIKIGMLYSKEIIEEIAKIISQLTIPIVIDPVFIAKSGVKLLHDDAIESLKKLFVYATVVTPNLFEAHQLFTDRLDEITNAPYKVLIKNNKMRDGDKDYSVDTLYTQGDIKNFKTLAIETHNTHGTGCSFSSAIAANLALGKSIEESIEVSKKFIYHAIQNAPSIGHGKGPIHHKLGGKRCLIEQQL